MSAHGSRGEFVDAFWRTRAAAPPYYPNLVMLVSEPVLVLAGVRGLERARPSASWAINDSFEIPPLARAEIR